MIYLNSNSTVSNPDIGFAFNYNDGVYRHGGFFRDASDNGTFKVFDNYSPEPDANIFIDTAHASFRLANIAATTFFGNVTGTVGTLSNFTTANLAEGINLYYTNVRVNSNVIAFLPSLAGQNITIAANGQINANTQTIALGAISQFLTTANVAESNSNLYYTNARVISAVLPYLTTANVAESNSNLYYTNVRVLSAVLPYLTTSNVAEGSNLYYTNARVLSALTGNLTIGNLVTGTSVSNSFVTAGNVTAGNVIANGAFFGSGVGGSITGANLLSATFIQGNSWLGIYTANIIESSNALFYTNTRVNSFVQPYLTTANVTEFNNLYYTNARVISAVLPYLTTSNVAEGSNLYYTNARVISTVTPYLTTANVLESNSNLYYTNARVLSALTGNVTIGNLTVNTSTANSYTTAGNINAGNVLATGLVLGSAIGGSLTGANLVSATNIQGNSWLGLYSANIIESNTALFYTNTRVNSNVIAFLPSLAGQNITIAANGQINANTQTISIGAVSQFLTTANVTESNSNLYYTNARVLSALTGNLVVGNLVTGTLVTGTSVSNSYITAGNVNAGNVIANTLIIGNATGGSLTGPNLVSVTNIQANSWLGLYSANVVESSSALYYTNARVNSNVIAFLPSLAGSGIQIQANGQINANAQTLSIATLAPFLTTSNVSEGSNLYYTNARVISALAGNITTGNVIANTLVLGSATGGSVTGANLLSANNIQGINWIGLYSANVIENTNLYFTNARVYSNVIALLPTLAGSGIQIQANGQINATASGASITSTSNVSEGSNLYYTNARVLSALTGNVTIGNLVTGTSVSNSYVTAGNVAAGNVIATTLVLGSATGGSVTGANLLSTNNIQSINWLGLYSANVIENTNLYFTNARVYSNVIALLPTLAGSGIQIQANGQINATASGASITSTSNVSEGSNLYYTNARVLSALTGNVTIGNLVTGTSVSNSYVTSGNINAGNIIANTASFGSGTGGSVTGANLISATNIQANSWLGLYTSNIIENTNLYFTNARVYSNVIALLPSLAGSGIQIQANGQINATASATSGFASTSNVANTVLTLSNFTTANLAEGSNLYYTNTRVLSALTGNITIGNATIGSVVANTAFFGSGVGGSVTGANLISANNIVANTAFFGSGTGGSMTGANLLSATNIQANSWLGLYTANVIETTGNLYFTNARVFANVIALLPTLAGSGIQIQANGQINATASATSGFASTSNVANTVLSISNFTTANLTEGSNLYYTNTRVLSALTGNIVIGNATIGSVVANTAFFGSGTGGSMTGANLISANNIQANSWLGLYTANVIESASNLYYTNARVVSVLTPYLTTSNVAEGSNLYYTNSRVISALSTDATIVIAANGQIRSNTSAGTVSLAGLTTANLAEGGANLYFSNARVTALIASGGTAIYRPYIATFRGNSQVTTLNLPVTPANNNFVTVIINGVTQLSNAYTLSGNVITLSGAPATNADIDVRIVEVGQNLTKDFNSRLFYGNSAANTTLISSNFTDSSILVFENGVAQVPGIDYSVNNGLLRFTTPPRTGVTVEIRELPTLNGTGTYLGGKNTEILANGQINSNITVGQNLTISANGQINAIVQEQIHPFLLSLL